MSDVRTTVSKCVGGRAYLSQMQVIGSLARRLTALMIADASHRYGAGAEAMAPGARASNTASLEGRDCALNELSRNQREVAIKSGVKRHECYANETQPGRPKRSCIGDQPIAASEIRFDTAPLRRVRQPARQL